MDLKHDVSNNSGGEPWKLWTFDEAPDELRDLFNDSETTTGDAIVRLPRFQLQVANALFRGMWSADRQLGDSYVVLLTLQGQ